MARRVVAALVAMLAMAPLPGSALAPTIDRAASASEQAQRLTRPAQRGVTVLETRGSAAVTPGELSVSCTYIDLAPGFGGWQLLDVRVSELDPAIIVAGGKNVYGSLVRLSLIESTTGQAVLDDDYWADHTGVAFVIKSVSRESPNVDLARFDGMLEIWVRQRYESDLPLEQADYSHFRISLTCTDHDQRNADPLGPG